MINIKPRRPLYYYKEEKKRHKRLMKIFIALICILPYLFCVIYFSTNNNLADQIIISTNKDLADNQALNWINATSVNDFKIEKLDGGYFYLSEIQNKVLLILK
jgi:hypothetical protein